jgi:hypothetical protein
MSSNSPLVRATKLAQGRSRRHGGSTAPQPWIPMEPCERIIPPEVLAAADEDPAVRAAIDETSEVWANNRYIVHVHRRDDSSVDSLSIRRQDNKAGHDWRHFQRIKNEIAGPHTEAFELYPDEDRLVDTANQFWLWCMPPGVRMPAGFPERLVAGPDKDGRFPLSRQRPFGKDDAR